MRRHKLRVWVVLGGVGLAGVLAVIGGGVAMTMSVCFLAAGMAEALTHPEDYF